MQKPNVLVPQCCESGSAWIRIKLKGKVGSGSESHQSDQLDPDPDPHDSDKLDPDPYQFADDKPKCIEYEPN
jgi:hypothetical protein